MKSKQIQVTNDLLDYSGMTTFDDLQIIEYEVKNNPIFANCYYVLQSNEHGKYRAVAYKLNSTKFFQFISNSVLSLRHSIDMNIEKSRQQVQELYSLLHLLEI